MQIWTKKNSAQEFFAEVIQEIIEREYAWKNHDLFTEISQLEEVKFTE